MLREVMSRELSDGSGTSVTLFVNDNGLSIVEAQNNVGTSSFATEDRDEAIECYGHPFSRETWLNYPGVNAA